MNEKIQKHLARLGVASRRQIEQWLKAGRIMVNDEVAHVGQRVNSSDQIVVDGKKINNTQTHIAQRVLLYHKPLGEICTRDDPQGRATVFDHLPELTKGRWLNVGRLDINTSGLLLFTNDGELVERLTHPRYQVEREYAVRVLGNVSDAMLQRLQQGVELEDGPAKFKRIREGGGQGANHWYRVVIEEGRKREVRRLWESQGIRVSKLIRIRFGNIRLPRDLAAGEYRELDAFSI